jgi:glycosyltransferase involved in cell wall biosynthesis
MNIFLVADPWIPVPPVHYGGIERVVHDLAQEFARRGHGVTIYAGPNSRAPGRLVVFGRNDCRVHRWEALWNTVRVGWDLRRETGPDDVIHNFGRLAYLWAAARSPAVKVNTYMRRVHVPNIRATVRWGSRNLIFTAVSDHIRKGGARGGGIWRTVYNGIDPSRYTYCPEVDAERASLVFLGRLERCKGAHTAIRVARAVGRPLILAGNISHLPEEKEYFEREIQPHVDGAGVRYVGVVDDEGKNRLLGSAAAVLFPIEWEEPFPVVLPESFACGTPLLAFARGGVPEGIEHGRTGFLSTTVEEMIEQAGRIPVLSRQACREAAEGRFSIRAIADDYLRIYEEARHG